MRVLTTQNEVVWRLYPISFLAGIMGRERLRLEMFLPYLEFRVGDLFHVGLLDVEWDLRLLTWSWR